MVLGGISQAASVAESASRVGITTRRAGASSGGHGRGRRRALAAALLATATALPMAGGSTDAVAGDPGARRGVPTEQARPSHTAEALGQLREHVQAEAAAAGRRAAAAGRKAEVARQEMRALARRSVLRRELIAEALD